MILVIILIVMVALLQFKLCTNRTLEQCVNEIVNLQVEPYAFITFQSNDTVIVNRLLPNITGISYILINMDTIRVLQDIHWKPNLYLIIISNIQQFEKFLKMFYRTWAWNPRGIFLIIYLGSRGWEEILTLSWAHYALRVYILDSTLTVASYFPFKNGKCGDNLQPENVYSCFNGSSAARNAIYNKTLPERFNKCPFRVEALKIVPYIIATEGNGTLGFEVQILRELARYSNLTLVFINHTHKTWGLKITGNFKYMFKDLFDKKIDAIAGMAPSAVQYGYFDKTTTHGFESSKYFVPAGKRIKTWRNFLMIFDYRVWMLMLIAVTVTCFALFIGGVILHQPEGYERVDYCIFQTYRAIFSALPSAPRSIYLRCVIILWVICCIILTNTYQSKLLTFLVKPGFEHEISSFEELLESELLMGGDATQLVSAQVDGLAVYQQLLKKWTNCSLSSLDCSIRAAEKRDFAVVQSERKTHYLASKYFMHPDGTLKLKPLNDKAFSYLICFYLDLGLPYYDKFNRLIRGLMENGLIHKWVKYLEKNRVKFYADEVTTLNMEHFILAFAILIIGHAFALCTLMIELCYHRVWTNRKHCLVSGAHQSI